MSDIVCRNTFCAFGSKFRNINQIGAGGGAKVYTSGKVSSLGVQKLQ